MTQRRLLLQKKQNELCWQITKLPIVTWHDPTNYEDVETALNTTVSSITGLETMNEKEKDDAEKFIHQHVTVKINRKKSEEDRKRHRMAMLSKKEKLYAMATEWKARCAKWTARSDKARMVLATSFKGVMKSSKMARKGFLAFQNDHITLAQLKWSKSAINEVKCTFKYLLAVKVNKLKICNWSQSFFECKNNADVSDASFEPNDRDS